ncbi:MAG: hypothetical protein PHQ52_07275 [Candidatus Omnitrophica bacterium]|nr:hypothetical protein [Candidatus Omnitrophota bacterium]
MKKAAIILVGLTLISNMVLAQNPYSWQSTNVSLGRIVIQNKKDLGITDEQQKKIDPIMNEARNNTKTIMDKFKTQGPDSRETMQKEIQKNSEMTDKKIEKVLTKTQVGKAKDLQKQREEQIKKQIEQRAVKK